MRRLLLGLGTSVAAATLALAGLAGSASADPPPSFTITTTGLNTFLGSVSCNDATHCIATGSNGVLVDYDGTSWTTDTGIPSNAGFLRSDSCTPSGSCFVGGDSTAWFRPTLTGAWQRVFFGFPKGTFFGSVGADDVLFSDISCVSATWCMAVGERAVTSSGLLRPTLVIWNGTRLLAMTPPPITTYGSSWNEGVSCWASSGCMVTVEYTNKAHQPASYAARWNGSSWHLLQLPSQHGTTRYGYGPVSCRSVWFCMATAWYHETAPADGVEAAIWNGTTWRLVGIPRPAGSSTPQGADGLSCPSTTYCVDVGQIYQASTGVTPFATAWNGSTWTNVSPPNVNNVSTALWWVTCPTIHECWTIGAYQPPSSSFLSMIAEQTP